MNKKSVRFFAVIGVSFLVFGCSNTSDVLEENKEVSSADLSPQIDITSEVFTVDEQKEAYEISVSLPSIGDTEIDSILRGDIQGRVEEFKGFLTQIGEGSGADFPSSLSYKGEIIPYSETLWTYVVNGYEFTGGAHGLGSVETFTYDLTDKKIIGWGDLFIPGSDAEVESLVRKKLLQELGEQSYDEEWVNEGTEINDTNYQSWVLLSEGVKIIFNSYQVGSYALGQPEVVLFWEELESVLRPEFIEKIILSDGKGK